MPAKARVYRRKRIFALAGLLLLIYFVVSFSRGFLAINRVKNELEWTQIRIEELKEENSTLEREIYLLQTPEYIERQARERLGLVKEGEVSVIFFEKD